MKNKILNKYQNIKKTNEIDSVMTHILADYEDLEDLTVKLNYSNQSEALTDLDNAVCIITKKWEDARDKK